MGLRCGELEGRGQGWGCVGEGVAGAVRICRDVPAPCSPPSYLNRTWQELVKGHKPLICRCKIPV